MEFLSRAVAVTGFLLKRINVVVALRIFCTGHEVKQGDQSRGDVSSPQKK